MKSTAPSHARNVKYFIIVHIIVCTAPNPLGTLQIYQLSHEELTFGPQFSGSIGFKSSLTFTVIVHSAKELSIVMKKLNGIRSNNIIFDKVFIIFIY
jgi:hypothetical protein